MDSKELEQALRSRFPEDILVVEPFERTLGRVRYRPGAALPLFRELRDIHGFGHLTEVGAIDWVKHREVFHVLWSDAAKSYLLLSSDVPAEQPQIESASPIWPSANWHEREAWEMVGVEFLHHPDLRHLLMPDGYDFRPLLRSFKLHEPEELEVKRRHV